MNIKHSDDTSLCIHKKSYKNGNRYYDELGNVIKDQKLIKRFRKLIIPPMWTNVLICKWDDGHIQATGRDAKGRKQYIYHSIYEQQRQEAKFKKMLHFGQQLPKIRAANDQFIKRKSWTREKLLALVVMILDETGIRIGNRQYVQRNHTYGLTTLRRKHVHVEDGTVSFDFKGKSNKERHVEIDDPFLVKLIKTSSELPGYELFRYLDEDKHSQCIDSDDVNQYVRTYLGEEFSSKDFRTWTASRLAIELYPDAIKHKQEAPRRKFTNILLRMVADELGNTPSVCKSYYIHPKIMDLISAQQITWKQASEEDAKGLSSSEIYLLECLGGE